MYCISRFHLLSPSISPIRKSKLSKRHNHRIAGSQSQLQQQHQKMETNNAFKFLTKSPYTPPSWASHLSLIPSHAVSLGHLPTPIHKWHLPNLPNNTEVWLKRDDLSGMQMSGNKVRKLEFLMADAVAQGADCIITIGGIQSNHCRATAVAAKYLNLDCYLILRTSKVLVDQDPGLTGNLLVERLVGAHVELISKEEYAKIGSVTLTDILKEKLLKEGRRPYVIPVGGSNSLGTWGYIEAIREIEQQVQTANRKVKFDDIVVACGSGATIAGLSLGSWLGTLKAKVHAFSVCDNPDYFYDFTQGLLDGITAGINSRDIVNIQNGKKKKEEQLANDGVCMYVTRSIGKVSVWELQDSTRDHQPKVKAMQLALLRSLILLKKLLQQLVLFLTQFTVEKLLTGW
ncbi:bifunctional D-cysteine desulfhydrase/1-aminocyclopropane-1-carboxylate deaminase, mitochondrial-like [Melia azedarach]|uniref:Bifunctional D-cysteine desulfhydrase/1-aminocyclopropane-1-carboxylate deaminase, mitochondrial-like n=1 Tax=Melia azedarach TaxID=155640 RepID=A0ACC1XRU4_MELAZ|nr:bifunctional D-cysteine desulfhydrase/1-aminocyclopropane-1-carboxylate deaminase, mitochondrial-like [Melia azedarach]